MMVQYSDPETRLRPTDGPLVRYAVLELGLKIVGRRRWKPREIQCPNCLAVVSREEWNSHRCGEKML